MEASQPRLRAVKLGWDAPYVAADEEPKSTRRTNDVGPTGAQLAENLRRIRIARGLSTARLSKLLTDIGRPIQPTGITKIEKRERKVDVDDLMALCAGLKVNPSALLLPPDSRGETELTGFGEVKARDAWHWADGQMPLITRDDDFAEMVADFQVHARPRGLRMVVHRHGQGGGFSAEVPQRRGEHGGLVSYDPYESEE